MAPGLILVICDEKGNLFVPAEIRTALQAKAEVVDLFLDPEATIMGALLVKGEEPELGYSIHCVQGIGRRHTGLFYKNGKSVPVHLWVYTPDKTAKEWLNERFGETDAVHV